MIDCLLLLVPFLNIMCGFNSFRFFNALLWSLLVCKVKIGPVMSFQHVALCVLFNEPDVTEVGSTLCAGHHGGGRHVFEDLSPLFRRLEDGHGDIGSFQGIRITDLFQLKLMLR